jgi:hypothetical protein
VPQRKYREATEAGTDGVVVLTPARNFAGDVPTTASAPRGCFAALLDVAATPPGQEGKFPRFRFALCFFLPTLDNVCYFNSIHVTQVAL